MAVLADYAYMDTSIIRKAANKISGENEVPKFSMEAYTFFYYHYYSMASNVRMRTVISTG